MSNINGWQEIKLGQIGKFSTSSVDKKSVEGQKQVSLVNYMDVYNRNTIDSNINFMKVSASVVERARSQVFRGDILFTPSSETPDDIGYSAVVAEELTDTLHSYHTVRLRPNSNTILDIRFSAWFANAEGVRKQFSQKCAGSTRYILSIPSFESVKCKIPISISVQREIANCLDTVQAAIEKTETLIHKHQQIKAGLMHDLFTRGVTADGKLRPPREQAPELYKETSVGWVPKEWNVGTIGSYAEIHNNLRLPLSSEVRESMAGEFPYYGPTGILDFINEYRVNGKFVLIGEDGDHFLKFDRMEMAQLVNGKFNVNNHAHLLTGKNGCSTEWIFIYFLHRDITFWLTRQGAGRYKLNKSTLEKLPLNLPKPDEQELIITIIMHFRDTEVAYFEDLEKLKKQKLGLMHDLLTGKVPVKIDQKETAHV